MEIAAPFCTIPLFRPLHSDSDLASLSFSSFSINIVTVTLLDRAQLIPCSRHVLCALGNLVLSALFLALEKYVALLFHRRQGYLIKPRLDNDQSIENSLLDSKTKTAGCSTKPISSNEPNQMLNNQIRFSLKTSDMKPFRLYNQIKNRPRLGSLGLMDPPPLAPG